MSDGQAQAASKSGAPDPLIGRLIADRFKITSLIARGGMGKVYRAEQAPLGRACAIKILNPNYNGDADPEFHRRFFREASITSRITHPNSVTIFDYGKTDDEIFYMAMEYLEGQTLHHALRDGGTMPEERVGRIAAQICRALREAHALEVIHRDLKPANIFLTRHGDDEDFVKVLDFGLVKHLSERPEEQLTQTGLFMGSPKYMAPEQIQGAHVDPRTDIYSLGIIMYEMLAGKVPFDRPTSVNILMAHVGEPPPPMLAVNPNLVVSPEFEDLVMCCIAKDPKDRWGTMDEVLQAIKRAHNVTHTGQLAVVNMSGPQRPLGVSTHPPTGAGGVSPLQPSLGSARMPVAAPQAAQGAGTFTGVGGSTRPGYGSGQHTPMGVISSVSAEGDPSGSMYGPAPAPRSKAWIALGVLVAAALGGLLGMAAFRISTDTSTPPLAGSSPMPPVAAAAAAGSAEPNATATATTTTPAPSPSPDVKSVTLKVTSDPPGATVSENGVELCTSTPCDVTFKGDAADPTKPHKLTFAKHGFRADVHTVKAGDTSPVSLKLVRAPAGGGGARPANPPAGKPEGTTPNGFKDLPY